MRVLLTGGAGYIGAHVGRLLVNRGDAVVVVDDLSTGVAERVAWCPVEVLDLARDASPSRLQAIFKAQRFDAVVHLAARKQVEESVNRPAWYYHANIAALANVLAAMEVAGVPRLVFSSSAAVYGMPTSGRVPEETPLLPINPYGETKLVGEWLARAASRAWGLRVVNLRYFNVAGSGWDDLGDRAVLNLIPMVFDRLSRGEPPRVFGDDYPTADGTCVRDFVHVLDLADAHLEALDYLDAALRPHDTFNVGTGEGASVLQVMDEVRRATQEDFAVNIEPRRAGDPPSVVADVTRIRETLGWRSKRDLADMVGSAWSAWQVRAQTD